MSHGGKAHILKLAMDGVRVDLLKIVLGRHIVEEITYVIK
jgi:hypothetical protein